MRCRSRNEVGCLFNTIARTGVRCMTNSLSAYEFWLGSTFFPASGSVSLVSPIRHTKVPGSIVLAIQFNTVHQPVATCPWPASRTQLLQMSSQEDTAALNVTPLRKLCNIGRSTNSAPNLEISAQSAAATSFNITHHLSIILFHRNSMRLLIIN